MPKHRKLPPTTSLRLADETLRTAIEATVELLDDICFILLGDHESVSESFKKSGRQAKRIRRAIKLLDPLTIERDESDVPLPVSARVAADAHPLPDLGSGTPAGVSGTTGQGSAGAAALTGLGLPTEIRLTAEPEREGETYVPTDPSKIKPWSNLDSAPYTQGSRP